MSLFSAKKTEPSPERGRPDRDAVAQSIGGHAAEIAKASVFVSGTIDEDLASIEIMRIGAAAGIFFLLAYLFYDVSPSDRMSSRAFYHWVSVATTLLFVAASFRPGFRRHWRVWMLVFCAALLFSFVLISSENGEVDSRYAAALLFPLGTASFINWGPRWQGVLGATCLAIYGFAEWTVPVAESNPVYRWLGLLASVVLSEFTSAFIERYRLELRRQVAQLRETARLRETEMATMAHDILSPIAALAGFADLLESEDLSEEEKLDLLKRIASIAWNMEQSVTNMMRLYQLQVETPAASATRLDPNRVMAEALEYCLPQAKRLGVSIEQNYGEVPANEFDRIGLERIMRNMIAHAVEHAGGTSVSFKTFVNNGSLVVEVTDNGPLTELDSSPLVFDPSRQNGRPPRATGLYVAREIAHRMGGDLKIDTSGQGVLLHTELPLDR